MHKMKNVKICFVFFDEKISHTIRTGCAYDAAGIVASVRGFGCNSIDNSFWFPNRIEQ